VKPGGWVEYQDFDLNYYSDDNSLRPEHSMKKWINGCIEASEKNNRDTTPGPKLKGWLQEAGFINVREHIFKLPIGKWPKDPVQVSGP
jgi:hypothetical protein